MKLISISEPTESKKHQANEYAIGIDLGTTNSVVACKINGKIEILGPIVPSIVSYLDDSYTVGSDDGIRSIKRFISNDSALKIGQYSAIEISSHILSHLKNQAQKYLDTNINKAVITVPAHFDDGARNATKFAANLAGLEVLRLINEPTAAAIAYGLDNKAEGIYLIYDFGGGTFDVSILKMQQGIFQVLATNGDSNLGGDDIDHAIMKYLKIDDQKLAIKIKEFFSKSDNQYYQLNDLTITKEEFETIVKPFIEKTIKICLDTIKFSNINPSELKEIILVGGSTRVSLVKQMLREAIKTPLDNIDPDLTVAIGAAIQADALTNGSDNLLLDITSLSIGLEVMGGLNERIINKNSTIPISATKYFTTHQDGQTGIIFHIIQGEREMAEDCRSLAKFELKNIPPMKAGAAKVAVTFTIDNDGLLNISAIEENTGVKQEILVKPSYGLSEDEIEKMLEASYINAATDINARKLAETKLKARDNIINIVNAITEDQDFISTLEKNNIQLSINQLEKAIETNSLDKIKESNYSLESASSAFIQARLNRQIKIILQGKHTQEFTPSE